MNPILYKYNNLLKRFNLKDIDEKIDFLKELTELLSSIESRLVRDEYINRFSKDLDLDKDNLSFEVNTLLKNSKSKLDTRLEKNNDLVSIKSQNSYKKILLESLRFIVFNPEKREEIIRISDFLNDKTKYWEDALASIVKININSEKTVADQLEEYKIDANIRKIINQVFIIKDRSYYLDSSNANNYINSMEKNKLIVERDSLKEQFSLLSDYESLSDELKIVYNSLAMDILRLDRDIKKMM